MIVHKNCRDCQFRAGEHEPYECAYALLTGLTRKARPPGDGCPYKIVGDRLEGIATMVIDPDQRERSVETVKPHSRKSAVPPEKYRELYDKGLSDREMAEQLHITPGGVYFWRNKNGLPPHNTNKTPHRVDTKEYRKLYDLGWSDAKIADKLGVTPGSVYQYRKRNHLPNHAADHKGEKTMKMEKKTSEEKQPAEVKKEAVEPLMKLPVLAEILKNISGTFPDAQISGESKTCRKVRFIGEYSAEGALESARIELLPA